MSTRAPAILAGLVAAFATVVLTCGAAPRPGAAEETFSATLHIKGLYQRVVLADASGRSDLVRDGKQVGEIPGVTRDSGREGRGPGEAPDWGHSARFGFRSAPVGKYVLWLKAGDRQEFRIWVERLPAEPARYRGGCGKSLDKLELVPGAWYRVDLRFAPLSPTDSCGVTLGRPAKAKPPKAVAGS